MHGDEEHLGPGSADERHQGDHERDRLTPGQRGNVNGVQAICTPSHHLQVHPAQSGLTIEQQLCHHGEQVLT